MTSSSVPADAPLPQGKRHVLDRIAERAVRARLRRIEHGAVVLNDAGWSTRYGTHTQRCPLEVELTVLDPRFWSELAFGGTIGAGEAYMAGWWKASDLTALVRILVQNRAALDGLETGFARLAVPMQKALHWLNRNTRSGSRRNIAAHYDLGNEFFALFLDPTMMYSSAIFDHPAQSLEEAQRGRLERICRKLDLRPHDHLLEIGTGWGALAIHAAKHYGCRVTTTTISQEQYALARERVLAAGLQDRITLLQQDYRDLEGTYDKLVSIEMIEAVGDRYYDAYFATCGRLLKPDGLMLLQAITIADQRYEQARRSVDFIQRHVFPGSTIPSVTALLASITRSSDLRLTHLEDIGPHYATTLARWRSRFFENLHRIEALGYPETFVRMWEFYLCYCEGGFAERAIGDAQILLAKPDNRRTPILGALPEAA